MKYLYGINPRNFTKTLLAYSKEIKELEKIQVIAEKLNYRNFEIRG